MFISGYPGGECWFIVSYSWWEFRLSNKGFPPFIEGEPKSVAMHIPSPFLTDSVGLYILFYTDSEGLSILFYTDSEGK